MKFDMSDCVNRAAMQAAHSLRGMGMSPEQIKQLAATHKKNAATKAVARAEGQKSENASAAASMINTRRK